MRRGHHHQEYQQRRDLGARVAAMHDARALAPSLQNHVVQSGAPLAGHRAADQQTRAIDQRQPASPALALRSQPAWKKAAW